MSEPQTYTNHARTDPAYHYFVVPVLFGNLGYRVVRLVEHPTYPHGLAVAVAIALVVLALQVRAYALRVQDRVIRMEERVRIAAVGSPVTLARLDEFGIKQLTALRFAPWAELGPLADRTIAEGLTPKQIKKAIVDWRADNHRV